MKESDASIIAGILRVGNIDRLNELWGDTTRYHGRFEVQMKDKYVYSVDGSISKKMERFISDNAGKLGELMWVCDNSKGEEQAFFRLDNGTNGKEGNALKSMKEAVETLEFIAGRTKWATLIGSVCDTLDDVYSWYFTFVV